MDRDFSEASKQRLLGLVDEVENEKWCDFTDWVGDRWYDFESWIGQLRIENYITRVNEYHKKVIDKNNTSKKEIEEIFVAVNAVSDRYKVRFASILSQLKTYRSMISSLSATVNPAHGVFNSMYIGNALVGNLIGLLQSNEALKKISGNGITNDELKDLSDDVKKYILSRYISSIIDVLPNVKVGDKVELPIGPDVTIYYSVEGEYDNGSDITINTTIEEHKLNFKNFSTSTGDLFGIGVQGNSDGTISVSGGNDDGSVSFDNLSGISNGTDVEVNGSTYSINLNIDAAGTIDFSETICTEFESGHIESTIGIKKHINKDDYVPLPVPETVNAQELSLSTPEGWKPLLKMLLPDVEMVNPRDMVEVIISPFKTLSNWMNSSVSSFTDAASAGTITGIFSGIYQFLPILCPI